MKRRTLPRSGALLVLRALARNTLAANAQVAVVRSAGASARMRARKAECSSPSVQIGWNPARLVAERLLQPDDAEQR